MTVRLKGAWNTHPLTLFIDNGDRKGNTMGTASITSATTITISIPAPVAGMLEREAKARHKTMASIIAEWLQEQADERAAQKALAKAIKANKGKPSIKAEDLYAQCGL